MRVEAIDMTEFVGRMNKGIYDQDEYQRALSWVKEHCQEGKDYNSEDTQRSRESLNQEWEDSVKMALIARDLMVGNPKLAESGHGEQALGHHAIAAGFQGQRQWTDHFPNGDFMEAMLNSSFDWNGKRAPYILATENDALNAAGMLFGYLLTHSAQIFADLRTYWRQMPLPGRWIQARRIGGGRTFTPHQFGTRRSDGTGDQKDAAGNPTMKPFWEITDEEMNASLNNTSWHPSITEYFPGGGMSTRFRTQGGMAATMIRLNLANGLGPCLQIAEGETVDLPDAVHDALDLAHQPHLANHLVCTPTDGSRSIPVHLRGDE